MAYTLNELSTQDGSLWKNVNKLKAKKRVTPILKVNNVKISIPEEVANVLAETFEKQFQENKQNTNIYQTNSLSQKIFDFDKYYENTEAAPIPLTNPKEITAIINKLNKRKAAGPDGIKK